MTLLYSLCVLCCLLAFVACLILWTTEVAEESGEDEAAGATEEEGDDGEKTSGATFRKMRLLDDQAEVSGEEGEDEDVGENEYVADGVFLVNDDDESSEDEDAPAGYRARSRYRTPPQSQPTQHIRYLATHVLTARMYFWYCVSSQETQKTEQKIQPASPCAVNRGYRRHGSNTGIKKTAPRFRRRR